MPSYQLQSREEILATKRAITESRLAYARETGDKRLIQMNERQLEQIAKWERES